MNDIFDSRNRMLDAPEPIEWQRAVDLQQYFDLLSWTHVYHVTCAGFNEGRILPGDAWLSLRSTLA